MKNLKRIVALAMCLVLCMGILVDAQAAALRITKQPKDIETMVGKKATFSVTAKGDGLKYQWYYKDPDMSAFKKVAKATSAKYSITMKQELDGRQFYCQVTDKNKKKVKTNKVTLSWDDTLTILTQPANATVLEGAQANVSVQVNGNGLSYAWWVKAPGADDYEPADTTDDTYAVTMSEAVDGSEVYCVITDAYGDSITSEPAKLKLYRPIIITRQPADVSVMDGETATVSLKASGSKLTYLWYQKAPTASRFTKTKVTKATYSVTMTPDMDGTQVYCEIKDNKGNKLSSDKVTLSWNAELKIQAQPKNVSVEKGKTARVTVKANGSGLMYDWYIRNKGEENFSLASTAGSSYSAKMSDTVDGREVYVVVTDENGAMITSDTVTLTMKRPIVITKHPTDMYVLKNKTAKVTVAATGKNLKYVWYVKAPGAKKYTKSKVTTPTYSVKMTAKVDGTMVYCEITDKNKKTETTKPVTLGMVAAGLQFVTENGQVTITDYTGSAKTLVVPPSINGNPVVAIGAEAFLNSKITQLTLPEGLLTIGEYAFSGSALTSLRIPTSITTIPEGACYGCKSLSNVILPDSVKIIGKRAFARCSLLKKMATY